ncbi:MAG TPA: 3-methyl-2-oxobutanoate hydroxymethyltransferase [Candidatus Kapabacteria bacterium]|nr:3-methyl-2-oxobutanoate hydroxymethyltransferase [Candidatus Kapabacteria bacterium]
MKSTTRRGTKPQRSTAVVTAPFSQLNETRKDGQQPDTRRVTTRTVREMKTRGERLTMITAYDYTFARLFDEAGADVLLVGDSLSNVIQGNETTIPVTLDEMIYHARLVVRGAREHAMVICDMPFMSFQVSVEEGFRNAGRIMKETGAGGVKIEGGERVADHVHRMSEAGIPVMGHLGLTPQSIHQFGSYRTRGITKEEATRLKRDAKALEDAGVFALVLEKIPAGLAKEITDSLKVSTIGIGAGPHCDGQVLVMHDLLGLTEEFHPRFVRRYASLAETVRDAVRRYDSDIKKGKFPNERESY